MLIAGRILLIIAFVFSLYGITLSIYGARSARPEFILRGRRSLYLVTGVVAAAFLILEVAFVRSDFSFSVVASHSSTTTPMFYRLTAMWSSQSGSLLLWVTLLSTWSSIVLVFAHRRVAALAPYATAVLLVFAAFFTGLLVFLESPFAASNPVPVEGLGLNPLLRHPSMMFHPPMLYSGYTLFTIPFAFAVAALITGRVGSDWIRLTRPFALAAWLTLGIGIILGARWSYAELGWGGYWAWDPVENAALLPWLTGTAFLHSALVQEKRGMLKRWNVSLVLLTGILAIMGTFLVRSGILSSIHAFGASTLGVPFLIFIAFLITGAVGLMMLRGKQLHSTGKLDSLLSREGVFLLNNLVLIGLCFVVFWGTFFPLISEAFTGKQAAVGPPWFDRYVTPLAIILVFLSGVGPVIAWRKTSLKRLMRTLLIPTTVALLALVVLGVLTDAGNAPSALLMFTFAAFSCTVVGQEFWRGARARRTLNGESIPVALTSLVSRNRRRYGGYIIHVGVAVTFVGVAASSAFDHVKDVRLKPGESAQVAGYKVTYSKPTGELKAASNHHLERIDFGAEMTVSKNGKVVTKLHPIRSYFPSSDSTLGPISKFFEGEATSEVGLKAGLTRDIWIATTPDLASLSKGITKGDRVFSRLKRLPPEQYGKFLAFALKGFTNMYTTANPVATFRVIVSPLVTWIWLGAIIVFCGGLVALWPSRRNSARTALLNGQSLPAMTQVTSPDTDRRRELEAAKEAKYSEIRDAELDYQTGKLSEADWKDLDAELRADAVGLIRELDELSEAAVAS